MKKIFNVVKNYRWTSIACGVIGGAAYIGWKLLKTKEELPVEEDSSGLDN